MSRYQSAEKCPCGARANAALRGTGVCSACDARLGRERFHRMPGHVSESGRVFGAEFVAEPRTTTIATNGPAYDAEARSSTPSSSSSTSSSAPARRARARSTPARALAVLEKRGADALEELDAAHPQARRARE
jgi:hypothetical protein